MKASRLGPAAVLVAGLALGAGWLLYGGPPPPPLPLGLAINLSGVGGTAGEYVREGATLAAEAVNRDGGIHGRPISLEIRDDRNTRVGVREANLELLAAGVRFIIGHGTSRTTLLAHQFLDGKDVLLLAPYAATTALSGLDDHLLRTSVTTRAYGRGMAWLLSEHGAQRAAFLVDMSNAAYTEDYFEHTTDHFSGDLRAIRFDAGEDVQWGALTRQILTPEPDAVVLLTEVTMTAIAAQKLRGAGFEGKLLASQWAQTPNLVRYGGDAVEGMSLLTFIDAENERPAYRDLARAFSEQLGRPLNARSARAHEAVLILARALRESPDLSTAAVKRTLLEGEYDTPMGRVRFDPYGDVERPLFEMRVEDARFRRVGEVP